MTTVPGNVRITRHIGDIDDNGHHTTVNLNEPVEVVTASGAAVTIDYAVAHWWDITLTNNCTITIINAPASSIAGELIVVLRQGGSGSYTVTFPASVDWQDTDGTGGGAAPTLWTVVGALNVITLVTFDGGTTWGGSTGSSGATTLDGLSDVTITSVASGDRLRYSGSLWVNSALRWEPLCDPSGSVVLTGGGDPVMVEMI